MPLHRQHTEQALLPALERFLTKGTRANHCYQERARNKGNPLLATSGSVQRRSVSMRLTAAVWAGCHGWTNLRVYGGR